MKKYIAIIAVAVVAAVSCTRTDSWYRPVTSGWLQDEADLLDQVVLRMPLSVVESALEVNLDDIRLMNSRADSDEYYTTALGRFATNGKPLSEDGAEWTVYVYQEYTDGKPLVVRGHGGGDYSISYEGIVPCYADYFEEGATLSYTFRLHRRAQVIGAIDEISIVGEVVESHGYSYKLAGADLVGRNISFEQDYWRQWSEGTLSGEFTMAIVRDGRELDFVTHKY